MLVFPNSKINLGLHVVSKRSDGYHNIETVFYPVGWNDILEVIENVSSEDRFSMDTGGIPVEGNIETNLVFKAWKIMSARRKMPPLKVFLYKNIPMGAGLGGGSSDAAHFINLLDQKFDLGIGPGEKIEVASQLGSDCAFFIKNRPVLALGKGDEFSEIKIDLSAYFILLVYPAVHSSTALAYGDLKPQPPKNDLRHILENSPVDTWKHTLINDFEYTVFKKFPQINSLKKLFYDNGALYASLSGSGSAVFGIFTEAPTISFPPGYSCFLQKPKTKVL